MRKYNAENELAKREYVAWLKNAGGRHVATVDSVVASIHAFEAFNRYGSFKAFRREQAVSFKIHLTEQTNAQTGKPLSKATLRSRLMALRAFFEWLSREPGFRKTVHFSDAAYFNLLANDARVASASREQTTPSLEQVIHVLEIMPSDTLVERRDRALIAFIILTGARDAAVASMRLKHVNIAAGRVFQDARDVKTKRAKSFTSIFYPVGDLPRQIVSDWVGELQRDQLFGPDDPVFPATKRGLDEQGLFHASGLEKAHWTSAAPIRAVFRRAFVAASFDYFQPHSLRRTLMRLAASLDLTNRQLKAWSESLGHESVLTSLVSYGGMTVEERAAAMASIAATGAGQSNHRDALANRIAALLAEHQRA